MARALAAVALAACLTAPAAAQVGLLMAPALPSPTDVVKLIDVLTKKDSATSVDVKLGKTVGQGKLLIATTASTSTWTAAAGTGVAGCWSTWPSPARVPTR